MTYLVGWAILVLLREDGVMDKQMAKLTNTQKVQVLEAARAYRVTGKPPKMVGWTRDMQKAFCLATQVSLFTKIRDNSDY